MSEKSKTLWALVVGLALCSLVGLAVLVGVYVLPLIHPIPPAAQVPTLPSLPALEVKQLTAWTNLDITIDRKGKAKICKIAVGEQEMLVSFYYGSLSIAPIPKP
jgi:hypothetical protein